MGLDMYIIEISRTENKETSLRIPVDEFSEEHKDLLPYCNKVKIDIELINIEKIKKDYNIPLDARITYSFCRQTTMHYGFKDKTNSYEVNLIDDEIKKYIYIEPIEYYIVKEKDICYWRGYSALQIFIHEIFKEKGITVENCGYYKLSIEDIKRINKTFSENIPLQDNLFYHEWY